jgi:integrase
MRVAKGIEVRSTTAGSEYIRINIKLPGHTRMMRKSLGLPPTVANIEYAKRLLAEIRAAIKAGTFDINDYFPSESNAPVTIAECVKDRMDRKLQLGLKGSGAGWEKSTYDARLSGFTQWIVPYFGSLTLEQLSPDHIRKFLKESDLTAQSAKQILSLMNPLIKEALAEGRITKHPYKHIDVTDYCRSVTAAQRKEVIEPFTPQEIQTILDPKNFAHESDMHLIKFLFATGMRIQEAPALRRDDYDIERRKVKLHNAIGTANSGPYEKGLKTGMVREIDLLPDAIDAIDAMVAIDDESEYIFVDSSTLEPYSLSLIRQRWVKILANAGIPFRSLKQTRHTFVSIMLSMGENSKWVQHQTGHTNTAMFDLHYAKWMDINTSRFKDIRLADLT